MEPTDPATLTAEDRQEIVDLTGLDDAEFARAVNEWVAQPDDDGSGSRVFQSRELVTRTWKALTALIAENEVKQAQARRAGKKQSAAGLAAHKARLAETRTYVRQIQDTVRREAEAERVRQEAEGVALRILRDVFPAEYRRAVNLLKAGTPRKQVIATLKAEGRK